MDDWTKRETVIAFCKGLSPEVREDPSNQWRFVKVTEDTFHWQNVTKQAEGLQVNCEVFARRIQ